MNVLGFLAGELQYGADLMVVAAQLGAGMVEDEGQDEPFDEAEQSRYSCPIWLRAPASSSSRKGLVAVRARFPGMKRRSKSSRAPGGYPRSRSGVRKWRERLEVEIVVHGFLS